MANKSTITAQVVVSVDQIAQIFCDMDDDAQAQFFVKVGEIMKAWPAPGRIMQLHAAGRHLRDCTCSTNDGRRVVEELYESMQPNA